MQRGWHWGSSEDQFDKLLLVVLAVGLLFSSPRVAAQSTPGVPTEIRIEAIGVLAFVEPINITNGVMEAPSGLHLAGWYEESNGLGVAGNTLLTGYFYWDGLPALFSALAQLQPGDRIELTGSNGVLYHYEVVWAETYPKATAPLQTIVGATLDEVVTLITDGGLPNPVTRAFEQSTVVRAVRVQQ
jgi:sortase (surface protein transpeptidase)